MRRELLEGPIAATLLRKTLPVIAGMLAANGLMAIVAWWQIRRLLRQVSTPGEAAESSATKG